jgi:hypothetical protein
MCPWKPPPRTAARGGKREGAPVVRKKGRGAGRKEEGNGRQPRGRRERRGFEKPNSNNLSAGNVTFTARKYTKDPPQKY